MLVIDYNYLLIKREVKVGAYYIYNYGIYYRLAVLYN